jgi:hypothetical protein
MKTLTVILLVGGFVLPAPIAWTFTGLAMMTLFVLAIVNLVAFIEQEHAERRQVHAEAAHRADVEFWTKVYERPTSPARRLVAAQMLDYLES